MPISDCVGKETMKYKTTGDCWVALAGMEEDEF